MKILFAGTPEIAVATLAALAASPHDVVGVLTAPDRQVGRGRRVGANPVKACATALHLPVLQPERLGAHAREEVGLLGADLLVCVAYGRIFGPRFLGLFESGGINLHPSLLPRYRGPSPIPAAILAGDLVTGVSVQTLALEMDAGDILRQEPVELDGTETTASLTARLGETAARLVALVVGEIADGTVTSSPQDADAATYTGLIRKSDGQIDWTAPAQVIERAVRAYNSWPLAFTEFKGQRLNILESAILTEGAQAQDGPAPAVVHAPGTVVRVDNRRGILVETGNGQLALTRLQLQSRKALRWDSFLNGVGDFVGAVLGG